MRIFSNALLASTGLLLASCSSHSVKAVKSLDTEHSDVQSASCRQAIEKASANEDLFTARLVAGPALMLASGGTLAIPVVLAQLGLDTKDRLDAATIKSSCNDKPTDDLDIASGVAQSAALSVIGTQLPVGPIGTANSK